MAVMRCFVLVFLSLFSDLLYHSVNVYNNNSFAQQRGIDA